jgi:hypothetical protein
LFVDVFIGEARFEVLRRLLVFRDQQDARGIFIEPVHKPWSDSLRPIFGFQLT